ncbi:YodC family protein [Pseudomonas tolaasii]|uniref:YodC family protein n=1 Tax=Pseudomonas tolaasii TaxID=29442 RepID=UPI001C580033|nr:DUF2158 domain-containing protein [Pseudomonas tolaasii]MBW1250703.1 YodC family protein [Pseudomonas tolaasii]
MSDIVKGAVVQLKSGGPKMTVSEIDDFSGGFGFGPKNGARCIWFEGNKPQEQVFDVEVLALA